MKFTPLNTANLPQAREVDLALLNTFSALDFYSMIKIPQANQLPVVSLLSRNLTSLKIEPIINHPNFNVLEFSLIVNEFDAFVYLSKNEIEKINSLSQPETPKMVTEISCEYLIRKFFLFLKNNWILSSKLDVKFIGLETQDDIPDVLNKAVKVIASFEDLNIEFYILLPDELLEELINNSNPVSVFKSITNLNELGDENFIRIDYAKISVPTNQLIDILRKDGQIVLSDIFSWDKAVVCLNGVPEVNASIEYDGKNFVAKYCNDEEVVYNEIICSNINDQRTIVTISSGPFVLSQEDLKYMPKALQLSSGMFPEVNLIIGNETVSKALFGRLESGEFCVKVI